MSHKIKFVNKTQDQNEHMISFPVPKKSQTKIRFYTKFYLPRVVIGSWNLQKGESLEVAMEILGTSPLGDEEAPIFFPWKPW